MRKACGQAGGRSLARTGRRIFPTRQHVLAAQVDMDKSIDQFVAVTGASVDDARNLLEACGGNLDLAINMHMEREGGGVTGSSNVGSQEESYKEL